MSSDNERPTRTDDGRCGDQTGGSTNTMTTDTTGTPPTDASARRVRSARARRTRIAAALAAAPLLLGACGGSGAVAPAAAPPPMRVTVTPAPDGTVVPKGAGAVEIVGIDGTLREVDVVDATGAELAGAFDRSRSRWTSTARLVPKQSYSVTVAGVDTTGRQINHTSKFSTKQAPEKRRLFARSVSPVDGSTVGVAYPLVVGFNRPVHDRAAVMKALQVTAAPQVEGAWYWIDASAVHFRPKEFWPKGTEVTLNANLDGVYAGKGVWGSADRTTSFTVGRQQVIQVDVEKHELSVVRNGKTLRTFPVSTGKPGWETRNGTKVIMEKVTDKQWTDEAIDAPEDYELESEYAMRMTNSGEFIHDAPWNGPYIGRRNASHGCVGLTSADMRWLYNNTMVGDAIVVTGSPKKFTEIWNRYQDWNVGWKKWRTGNVDLIDG